MPDSVQIEQILEKVKPKYLHTGQQRNEITVIEKMKASDCTNVFFRYFWNAFMILKDRFFVEEKAATNKTASDFYKEVNQLLLSEKTAAIRNLFEGEPVARKNVTFKVMCEIREKVLETAAEAMKKKAHDKLDTGEVFAESPGGRGKIRYIGGWCVRSIIKEKKRKVIKDLYKVKKREECSRLRHQLDLLHHLEASEHQLMQSSNDKESLEETSRGQNVRKGLTNITDQSFNFFMLLDKKIRLIETSTNIDLNGTNFHSFVISQLLSDQSLFRSFCDQFVMHVEIDDAQVLYNEILQKYSLMSLSQLRKRYLKDVKAQKTEAHRKQIKIKEKTANVKTNPFNMAFIKNDSSENKLVSHRRLQSEILKNDSFISLTFTKADMEKLCKAYRCQFERNLTKKLISEKLYSIITSSPGMLEPLYLEMQSLQLVTMNLLRVQVLVASWSLQWQNHLQANQRSAAARLQCQGYQQRESHPKIKGKAERKAYQSILVEYVKKSVKTM